MDKRANNKGIKGNNGGRPSKAEEQNLIEKLSPLEEQAFIKLSEAIDGGKDWAIKMFFEYMFGKPKQQIDNNNTHTFMEGFDIRKLYDKETQ